MSFFTSVESFLQKEGKQASQYAQGLVTLLANHPQAALTSGPDKHAAIVDQIKALFAPALSAFGAFAHDVASLLVHDAFDLVTKRTPALLQPLLATVETAAQSAVASEITKDVAAVQAALSASPFAAAATPAPVQVPGINAPVPAQQVIIRPVAPVGEHAAGGSATVSGP